MYLDSRGFWGSRTGLEKALLAVVGVCGIVAVATGCVVAFSGSSSAAGTNALKAGAETPMTLEFPIQEGVRKTGIKAGEVCTTPECVIAG